MERALRLLEIIYASAVAHEIQNLRHNIWCGCKIYAQDCSMMMEEEGWKMHGLTAMERVNRSPSVWHEFLHVLGILNIDVHKEFADHLMGLQKRFRSIFYRGPITSIRKQPSDGGYPTQLIAPSRPASGALQHCLF